MIHAGIIVPGHKDANQIINSMFEKYILLDIDGVMVPANGWKTPESDEDGFYKFKVEAEKELGNLLLLTGATIVLTSTHRYRFDKQKWKRILNKRLKHVSEFGILDDYAGPIENNSSRYDEIRQWGEGAGLHKQYVILDDDKALHNLPLHIKKHWVPIASGVGFTAEAAKQAVDILNDNPF
jgi:hypothetical protein